MTRRDYIALADVMARNRKEYMQGDPTDSVNLWLNIRDSLITCLQADNPNFNRDIFLKACDA